MYDEKSDLMEKNIIETALNTQRDTFFVFDPSSGKPIKWNKAFRDITGYTDEEISKLKAPNSYYAEEELQKILEAVNLIEKGQISVIELNLRTKDGNFIPFEYKASGIFDKDKNLKYIVSVGRDITARKIAEEKILHIARFPSENPNPVLRVNLDEVLYINTSGKKLFYVQKGSKVPEFLKKNIQDSISSNLSLEIELKLNNKIYSLVITPIKKSGYANIYGRDITDRKKAEQKLIESEEKFRSISEESLAGIYIIQDNVIKYVNQRGVDIFGRTREEVLSWTAGEFLDTIHEEDKEYIAEQARKKQQGIDDILVHNPFRCYKDNGELIWLDNYSKTITYEGKSAVLGMYIDDTDKVNASQMLQLSEEKYREAFEQVNFYKDLFTHDMNNLLNNILTSVELTSIIKEKKDNSTILDEIMEIVEIIDESAKRGAKLVSNIRKLSNVEKSEKIFIKTNICTYLNDAIEYIRKNFQEKDKQIQVEVFSKNIFIQANELLLDVFENILINSIKYNDKEKIEILINISEIEMNGINNVKLEFIDNSIGIKDLHKESIFDIGNRETKGGKGMGIGLSLVKKAIENYGGKIWVEDRIEGTPSMGSNFIIVLPTT